MSRINDPEKSLPYFLRGAFREFETALGRYLENFGIPMSQFYILRLKWNEAGNSQIDLASRAFMSESVASQVIKKMEAANLVERRSDPEDGRARLVFLTPKGRELRERIVTEGLNISKSNAPDIPAEDIKTAINVLIHIRKGFEAYNQK